jgi:hypothetical protein
MLVARSLKSTAGLFQSGAILRQGNGTADASWKPNQSLYVESFARDYAGHIYMGGTFKQGASNPSFLARYSSAGDGTADATFDAAFNGAVRTLATHAQGRLIVAGAFKTIGGQTRRGLAILSEDAMFSDGFDTL